MKLTPRFYAHIYGAEALVRLGRVPEAMLLLQTEAAPDATVLGKHALICLWLAVVICSMFFAFASIWLEFIVFFFFTVAPVRNETR